MSGFEKLLYLDVLPSAQLAVSALPALIWRGFLLLISYFSILFLYRLSPFHPLAKYPGPFLAKLTDLYGCSDAFSGGAHLNIEKVHQKYGKIVRYGPNRLLFNDNTALQEIYIGKANVRKSDNYLTFPSVPHIVSTHSAIDKMVHARKRRILAHCLSEKSLRGLSPNIINCVNDFTNQMKHAAKGQSNVWTSGALDKGWSQAINMSQLANCLTFDLIGALNWSKSFGMTTNKSNIWIQNVVARGAVSVYGSGFARWLVALGGQRLLAGSDMDKRAQFHAFVRKELTDRLARDETDDFLAYVNGEEAKAINGGRELSFIEIATESNTLMAAGSDTSSTALAGAFFYLTHHPDVRQKLNQEIRSTFSDVEEVVPGPKLSSCTYLRAVLDETMRLSPPIPTTPWREVLPGGLVIDSKTTIPAGIDVGVSIYAIHRNAEYFSSPTTFDPKRWLADPADVKAKERLALAQSAYAPFSLGTRNCVGKNLALRQLTVALARTVWLFDFKKEEGNIVGMQEDGTFRLRDCFVAEKDGPMVQFKVRGEVA